MNIAEYTGKVKVIIFRKDDYMVGILGTEHEDIKFTGTMYGIDKDDELTLKGKMVHHQRFGEQLDVEEWERPIPSTIEQVVNFLSSGLVKGVGEKRAKEIANS